MNKDITQTFINGREYKKYDELNRFIKKIEDYFINTTEYSGYPTLPDFWTDIFKIYDDAKDEQEIEVMFMTMFTKLLEAYRHWTTDKDSLFTSDGVEKHKKFIEDYKFSWKENGRNWNSFINY